MNHERIISAYKNYFKDFNSSLSDAEAQRVDTNKSYISRIENNRQ